MAGTVEKYGSSWRIRWDAEPRPNGKRLQRSKAGFRTRREAEVALREKLEEVRRHESPTDERVTVGDYLQRWLEGKRGIRATTLRAYEGHVRVHLVPHIGHVRLVDLRPDHLDRMYAAIQRGDLRPAPGQATVRRIHATSRAALNSALKRRLLNYNPATQVELPPEPLRERDVLTPAQLARFLQVSGRDRLAAAYRLIAFTGLRRGECCGLRWRDVDLEQGLLTVRQQLTQSGRDRAFNEPKTRRGARVLSLDGDTVVALRRHKAAQAVERLTLGEVYNVEDLVFCREDGSPVAPEQVSRRFIVLARRAGLPRIVLHGLRHTHATHALAAGVDLAVVSKRLGHARDSFTADTYTRVLPQVDREAADLIARMVRLAGEPDAGAR